MSGGLRLTPHNSHEVSVDGRRILFHVPTTSLFELDELAADVLDLFREWPEVTEDDVRRRFDGRHPPERVVETLEELLDLEIIHNGQPRPANHPPVAIANYPISTLVLNMHGNVWEWVEDCWNDRYEGAPDDGGVWTSGNCSRRVLRGGSW